MCWSGNIKFNYWTLYRSDSSTSGEKPADKKQKVDSKV